MGGPSIEDTAGRGRRSRPDRARAVVVCVPGLEDVVGAELEALGITHRPAGSGALAARVTDRQLYLANVTLASATRVLVDAG
ncbi:MAG: THUMP domain-containing protein, partial [Iamia sp.]